MNIAKPAAFTVLFLLGMLVCEYAWAEPLPEKLTEQVADKVAAKVADDDYAKLPVCTLSQDGKSLAVEPCRTAPAKQPMPRRPVPQIIQRMPQSKPLPKVAMPAMPPSPPLDLIAKPPVPTTSCDAGGCYGANGVRYNNAGANGVITPSGKVCTKASGIIQC